MENFVKSKSARGNNPEGADILLCFFKNVMKFFLNKRLLFMSLERGGTNSSHPEQSLETPQRQQ